MFSEDDDRWDDHDDRDWDDLGDPRRCPHHPHVITSSADGMIDGLCYLCESAMDEDAPPPTHAVTLDFQAAPVKQPVIDIEDDDIPF